MRRAGGGGGGGEEPVSCTLPDGQRSLIRHNSNSLAHEVACSSLTSLAVVCGMLGALFFCRLIDLNQARRLLLRCCSARRFAPPRAIRGTRRCSCRALVKITGTLTHSRETAGEASTFQLFESRTQIQQWTKVPRPLEVKSNQYFVCHPFASITA
jgi:hypothetical protein